MKILSLVGSISIGALSVLSACSSSEPAPGEAAAAENSVNANSDDAAANANTDVAIENTENVNAATGSNLAGNAGEGEESLEDFSFLDDIKGSGSTSNNAEVEAGSDNLLAEDSGNDEGDDNFDGNDSPEASINANIGAINSANIAGENVGNDPTAVSNEALGNLEGGQSDDTAIAAAEANTFESADAVVAQSSPIDDSAQSIAQIETPPPPAAPLDSESSIAALNNTPAQAAASAAPLPATDEIEPITAMVDWVGYRVDEKARKLQVEIVAKGRPDYEIFEESNKKGQKEIVIRFYQAGLRSKLRWDINSSEFRSPVAYIRMRDFKDKGVVDVVLTHRDPILPEFYEKDGKFLLNYSVPDRYFGNEAKSARVIKDKAQMLAKDTMKPVVAGKEKTGKLPVIGFKRITFKEKPLMQPLRNLIRASRPVHVDRHGLPENFDRRVQAAPSAKRTGVIWTRYHWVGVAQDNLEEDFGDEVPVDEETVEEGTSSGAESNIINAANSANAANAENSGNAASNENASAAEDIINNANSSSNNAANANTNTNNALNGNANAAENGNAPVAGGENIGNGAFEGEQNAFSNLNGNQAEPSGNDSNTFGNQAAEGSVGTESGNVAADDIPLEGNPAESLEEGTELTGSSSTQPAPVEYNGRPVSMEFFESPLNLVLKTFSAETGNNFIFSNDVGALPVSINFKDVPWDEALKAILETHSLGMVRIGKNVVRIDLIANLTQYMASLEQAKQFEARRVPTKVMIFRLNNAVAKDVNDRLMIMMGRDIELDPRIKVQDDVRTNALVMEAPEVVLAKAKAIVERLDLPTPQVEIASRIVEVQKTNNSFFGFAWGNNFNFDPGRALGFGTLNFPNSLGSNFAVDPGVSTAAAAGTGSFRFGSLNKFLDLDLLLKVEEKKGTTNVLQSNRVLVLDGQKALLSLIHI